MEIKFSVCGPDIGGAKSGINFDPNDPRRWEVLERWYKAVFPVLKNYYGTGGDLNVDELKDVIPITEELGLWHPQEGIVNGHFLSDKGEKVRILGQLRYGCAKIVGIIDRVGGIIDPEGLSLEEVKDLFLKKDGNKLNSPKMISFEETNAQIWDLDADIFIPAAASKIVNRDQVDRMIKTGLEVISAGANVPFTDDTVFFGPTAKYTDSQVSMIPDFIANCGMARVFAYLMKSDAEMTDAAIFEDVSNVIREAISKVHDANPEDKNIGQAALTIALEKLT